MASVNGVGATGATTGAAPANPKAAIDKDAFLRLLVEQLRHQDPMQPTDSSQFMAQMAQFSTVEQLTNLAKDGAAAAKSAKVNEAVGLLGRTVSYNGADGMPVTGVVERIDLSGSDGPTLTIGGQAGISPSALKGVA
jgi:flagellar basal-body rod modification protein FlgD